MKLDVAKFFLACHSIYCIRGRGCPCSMSKYLLRHTGGYEPGSPSVTFDDLRDGGDAQEAPGLFPLRGLHVAQLGFCASNRASGPELGRNASGKVPKSALRLAGGPISGLSREQSGPNPARKPELRPRSTIAEHRGLGQRKGQRWVQSWPRAHVLGCGSQRLSKSFFTHLGRRGGPFAPSLKLGRGVF